MSVPNQKPVTVMPKKLSKYQLLLAAATRGPYPIIADCGTSEKHRYSIISVDLKSVCDVTAVAWKHGKQKRDPQSKATAELLAHSVNVLPQAHKALTLLRNHLTDLAKSNPGYLSKLVLQNYALWQESHDALAKAIHDIENVKLETPRR
jgi:hypothetical protein